MGGGFGAELLLATAEYFQEQGLGVDGIYMKKGRASGCFLPQVAPDAWKDPETEVYLFTAEVFGADFSEI